MHKKIKNEIFISNIIFNKHNTNITADNINDCIKTLAIIMFSDNIPSCSILS